MTLMKEDMIRIDRNRTDPIPVELSDGTTVLCERRKEHEPAPLICDKCDRVTMHEFVGSFRDQTTTYGTMHDYYKCTTCGFQRIWG